MKQLSHSDRIRIYLELLGEIRSAEVQVANALTLYEKDPLVNRGVLEAARAAYLTTGNRCIARFHELSNITSDLVIVAE